jgi:hypothetical protein
MALVEKFLIIACTAVLGMFGFYLVAAVVACGFIWPTVNLCGVVAAVYAAPLGLIVGGIGGWQMARHLLRAGPTR